MHDFTQKYSPRRAIRYIKEHKKEFFWLWILYQSIKGIATVSFIWIPLWLVWKNHWALSAAFELCGIPTPASAPHILREAPHLSHIVILHPAIVTRSVAQNRSYWGRKKASAGKSRFSNTLNMRGKSIMAHWGCDEAQVIYAIKSIV